MGIHKNHGRRGKGTRPFMPLFGKRNRTPRPEGEKPVNDNMTEAEAEPRDEMQENAVNAGETPSVEMPETLSADAGREEADAAEEGLDADVSQGLNSRLAAALTERDMYLELARRERADFDNYRKRVERERGEIKRDSLAAFLKEFFGPLDDMDRVLLESAKTQSFDALVGGVRIMQENFWRTLAKAGVRKIDAKGKPFDPALHEAIAVVPSADVPPNTVLEAYENGYKLDDHILRPARVVVSRAPDA